jgi:hypothetical protein
MHGAANGRSEPFSTKLRVSLLGQFSSQLLGAIDLILPFPPKF